jgi:2'-5' RNA ligase
VRLFVALDIPEAVRTAIKSLIGELKPLDDSWKWVRTVNLHVTLKFLGEVAPDKLTKIVEALRTAPAAGPVVLTFRGLGFFPNEHRPRVLWVGMDAPQSLIGLAAAVEATLVGVGFAREEREFTPHLTLARSKNGTVSPQLREAIATLSAMQFGMMDASTFHLVESRLKSSGPEYTTLESFPLAR